MSDPNKANRRRIVDNRFPTLTWKTMVNIRRDIGNSGHAKYFFLKILTPTHPYEI